MRKTIKALIENWPKEGIALHGTSAKNIPAIRRERIANTAYCTVFPYVYGGINTFSNYSTGEILERAIGASLFAGKYGFLRGDPAIIVLKGKRPLEFFASGISDHDTEDLQTRGLLRRKEYRSFGKNAKGSIPPDRIGAVVKLTKSDYTQ